MADVDRSSLERDLADLRTVGRLGEDGKREKPISAKTSNHVLGSVKAFMNWAVERGYALSNPLARVKGLNARVDPRRIRRALNTEELCALVPAARLLPLPAYFGRKAALWLQHDLARARVAGKDESRVRSPTRTRAVGSATCTRWLVTSGANPKLVQTLARHSTPGLTFGVYARFPDAESRRAVMALEPITAETAALRARATETGAKCDAVSDPVSVAESGSAPSAEETR